MTIIEGQLVANEMKIGIVVSRFNELITSKLLSGAVDGLLRHGVSEEDIDIVYGYPVLLKSPIWLEKWHYIKIMMLLSVLG